MSGMFVVEWMCVFLLYCGMSLCLCTTMLMFLVFNGEKKRHTKNNEHSRSSINCIYSLNEVYKASAIQLICQYLLKHEHLLCFLCTRVATRQDECFQAEKRLMYKCTYKKTDTDQNTSHSLQSKEKRLNEKRNKEFA